MTARTPKLPSAEHPIAIHPTPLEVLVRTHAGRVVAKSTQALTLNEADYPPVQYIPISDVDMTLLSSTETSTYCPYKGDASYYSVDEQDGEIKDAAWTYERPYPAMGAIAGHLAFYPDRVEIVLTGSTPVGSATCPGQTRS
jgi:uncharacterized protein (DUF427 family)